MPLLVYLGDIDPIVSNEIATEVYDRIPGQNKKIVVTEGMKHGPFSHGVIRHETVKYCTDLFENAGKK